MEVTDREKRSSLLQGGINSGRRKCYDTVREAISSNDGRENLKVVCVEVSTLGYVVLVIKVVTGKQAPRHSA
jgi:hypothetical protein